MDKGRKKNMNNLLINEYPLFVLPSLAEKIGLNEAIFLQQLHFWLTKSTNIKEGKKWVYNSYPDWQKQFKFWSIDTIKRTIKNLEKQEVIISNNFNKLAIDKTKWYTINYSKIA